jgi:NTE family protein
MSVTGTDIGNKTISLVLGSGGARGMAHIGVIRCLHEHGYTIRYISGSSIGALVGGIYAAGKLDEYEKWVLELDRTDILRLLDWSFSHGALFKGDKIIEVLEKLIGNRNIEDLPIGFTAVATDLDGEREVWFNSGPLFDAIRASIAVPMVFEPVRHLGRLLVDGGLVNPIPIAPVLNIQSDRIFAVDLNAAAEGHITQLRQEAKPTESENEYRIRILGFIEKFLPGGDIQEPDKLPGLFDLILQSMDVMQTTIARYKMAGYTPDMTVNIPRDACGFFEFYRAGDLIDLGYQRTVAALALYEEAINR